MSRSSMHDTTRLLQGLAKVINASVKPHGFVLLTIASDGPAGSRVNYVSNSDRQDIVVALKEILARFEGQPQQSGRA